MHPFVALQLRVRPVGAAALAAALLVFASGAVPSAQAGDAPRHTSSFIRLEAEYVASIAGIPIGRGRIGVVG